MQQLLCIRTYACVHNVSLAPSVFRIAWRSTALPMLCTCRTMKGVCWFAHGARCVMHLVSPLHLACGAVVQRLQQPQAVTVHDAAPDWIAAVAQQERNVPNLVSSMPVTLYGSLLLLCHWISPFSRGHVSSRCCLPAWTPNVCIDSEPCLLSLLGL